MLANPHPVLVEDVASWLFAQLVYEKIFYPHLTYKTNALAVFFTRRS